VHTVRRRREHTGARIARYHPYNRDPMIEREQVLHVARLARLRLTDEEIERMPPELSKILDHIEKINELELDEVAPTSHVIELENVLREDKPRPSWPRERILEQAPDASDEGFRVPSPGQ
jgi:aspartyl-tRNA(Asn)/glutamyl-tRNA(Gln) amidotransferase subunit C